MLSKHFKVAPPSEEGFPEIRDRKSVTDPNYIDMPRCSACGKVIHPRDIGATAIQCPNCGEGIIIRCGKCRGMANVAKCDICGYEFP